MDETLAIRFLEPRKQSQNFNTPPQDAKGTVGHHNVTRRKRKEVM